MEMLKKFGLEDSKPTKMPMSMEIKLTKDDEADSVYSTKYRGLFQQHETPEWKWDRNTMDFITKLPSYTKRLQDEKLVRIYNDEIVAKHGVPVSIILDCDGRSTSRFCRRCKSVRNTTRYEYGLSSLNGWIK
ncbi:hypothetical protein Tco_0675707 [Tanacetum coccineum]